LPLPRIDQLALQKHTPSFIQIQQPFLCGRGPVRLVVVLFDLFFLRSLKDDDDTNRSSDDLLGHRGDREMLWFARINFFAGSARADCADEEA
jgi:hypothetical protein